MERNYTVDNNTYASNPGNARLNPMVWIKYNFKVVFLLTLSILVSAFLTFTISFWFSILLLIAVFANVFYWLRKKEHFRSGDSNGGLIVAINPTLVAVATDLTQGFGSYPVVKIIPFKGKENAQIGDRIPTVALYSRSPDDSILHWIDFHPIPLTYATNDNQVIERALNSYSEDQWSILEKQLKEIKKPYQRRLYKVAKNESDWTN